MAIFEIHLDGYLNWSVATNDLIKWVDAPTIKHVDTFLKENNITLAKSSQVSFLAKDIAEGIDVVLGDNGAIISTAQDIALWAQETKKAKDLLEKWTAKLKKEEEEKDKKWSRKEKKRLKKAKNQQKKQVDLGEKIPDSVIDLDDLDAQPTRWGKNKLGFHLPTIADVKGNKLKERLKGRHRSARTVYQEQQARRK